MQLCNSGTKMRATDFKASVLYLTLIVFFGLRHVSFLLKDNKLKANQGKGSDVVEVFLQNH